VGKGGVKVSVTCDAGDIAISKTEESLNAPTAPPTRQAEPPAAPPIPSKPSKPAKKKIGDVDVL
jgi:hypothetical protein